MAFAVAVRGDLHSAVEQTVVFGRLIALFRAVDIREIAAVTDCGQDVQPGGEHVHFALTVVRKCRGFTGYSCRSDDDLIRTVSARRDLGPVVIQIRPVISGSAEGHDAFFSKSVEDLIVDRTDGLRRGPGVIDSDDIHPSFFGLENIVVCAYFFVCVSHFVLITGGTGAHHHDLHIRAGSCSCAGDPDAVSGLGRDNARDMRAVIEGRSKVRVIVVEIIAVIAFEPDISRVFPEHVPEVLVLREDPGVYDCDDDLSLFFLLSQPEAAGIGGKRHFRAAPARARIGTRFIVRKR